MQHVKILIAIIAVCLLVSSGCKKSNSVKPYSQETWILSGTYEYDYDTVVYDTLYFSGVATVFSKDSTITKTLPIQDMTLHVAKGFIAGATIDTNLYTNDAVVFPSLNNSSELRSNLASNKYHGVNDTLFRDIFDTAISKKNYVLSIQSIHTGEALYVNFIYSANDDSVNLSYAWLNGPHDGSGSYQLTGVRQK